MQIVTDYRNALQNAERFERNGDRPRAQIANGLANSIWAVMNNAERRKAQPLRRANCNFAAHLKCEKTIAALAANDSGLPQTIYAINGPWPYLSREATGPAPWNVSEAVVTILPETWFR